MTKLGRKLLSVVCVAVTGVLAGCGSTQAAIPKKFCEVPVRESALSPLLPSGSSIKQNYAAGEARPGTGCTLSVDGHQILFADINRWDRAPEPTDWNTVGTQYKYVAQRKVSFPGYAAIGSEEAIVQATCNTRTAYMSVTIYFRGSRVEESPAGYKKLLRFVDDFVPGVTKKFDCTK
ncbi:hypothetical protein ABZ845_04545 [Streptomyces sp. NPDC047022]|uniref:hypothetical protein n=1 Tax=Streptomyces sp. NPDC047022 TaxID=3155737 RepID=UPI0033EDDD64